MTTTHFHSAERLRDTILGWLEEPPEIPSDEICGQLLGLHMAIVEKDNDRLKQYVGGDHNPEILELPWNYRAAVLLALYTFDDWDEWRELIERITAEYAGDHARREMVDLNERVTYHLENGAVQGGEAGDE